MLVSRCSIVLLLAIVTAAIGCTITIEGTPVRPPPQGAEEICVIQNPPVRAEFLTALKASLESKGLRVRVLAPSASPSDCSLSATYLGKWSWDFVPYLATGDIVVFREGSRVGDASYRAPRAGWALTFGIYKSTDTKVASMVDQIFPDRP